MHYIIHYNRLNPFMNQVSFYITWRRILSKVPVVLIPL